MPISKFFYPKYDIDLKRLGNEYDGGYLISKTTLKNTKNLISLGINDDWSFEKDFNKNNLKVNIYCFDNQLDLRFLIKRLIVDLVFFIFNFNIKNIYKKIYKIIDYIKVSKKFFFYKKEISYGDLKKILKNKSKIFVKIDIEGSEYRILDELLSNENILGAVIEFHNFNLNMDLIEKKLKKTKLKIVHMHGNNYSKIDKLNIPEVVEITLDRNVKNKKKITLPNILDKPNNAKNKEMKLSFS